MAADILAPLRRGPLTSPVKASLRPATTLTVAGAVLRLSHGYRPGEIKGAIDKVAVDHHRSKAWVKNHIRIAKRYLDGRWWQFKVEKFSTRLKGFGQTNNPKTISLFGVARRLSCNQNAREVTNVAKATGTHR